MKVLTIFFQSLLAFFKTRDGQVTLGAVVLLAIVSHFSTYNPWVNFVARLGNLLIFVYILWRAGLGKAYANLGAKRLIIATELESLAQQKIKAETELMEVGQRIAHLEAERKAILEAAKAEAVLLQDSIVAAARQEAENIRLLAERAALSEAKKLTELLKAQVADAILQDLEKNLVTKLDSATHDKLISQALPKVVLQ